MHGGRHDAISQLPYRALNKTNMMFSNSRMRVCKSDGYTLVLGRNDRVELAERDLCSVLVFGASVNATVLGIRRMVSPAVRGVSSFEVEPSFSS